ncbi:MAG: alanine--tRNA ligase, partial [Bacteroidales bacterium]|nr:alanine--tRNA ligase [Bacteroidales bacterium]
WDYSTKVIGFDPEKIWISIYEDDDEAFEIWNKKINVPAERIVRLGKKDNFWGPAGETGACGPCSELHYDRGPEYGCEDENCKPGCECERFLEYWNLVFNQFFQDENGKLNPLPKTGIDTGMGLERLATLVQNVDSVYETDEFKKLIVLISKVTGVPYEGNNVDAIRIIAEHSRAITFAMSDGIYPSNDGRGYVLRRILRRALRYSRQIGIKEPFIYKMVDHIVDLMGEFYPEIVDSAKNVKNVIEGEEKRFLETLDNGLARLNEIINNPLTQSSSTIKGSDAFTLYDTFGFPLEMTIEMAEEKSLTVEVDGFNLEMEAQKTRGKQSWKSIDNNLEKAFEDIAKATGDTLFLGYDSVVADNSISILYNGTKETDKLNQGEEGLIVLKETPFYGESGGQVGDVGTIETQDAVFKVTDTKKYNKTIIHLGTVEKGSFQKNEKITASVDVVNRNLIRANHTATHLLQAALRSVLGDHVKQAGSIVSPDRLRFDFSHFSAMTDDDINQVEAIVNNAVWKNETVDTKIMNIDEAVKEGAMAVFDEKYDDVVRVITVPGISKELCGGTHVSSTGEIGVFKILKEASPGAGVRRIEAVTLKGLLDRFNSHNEIINNLTASMKAEDDEIIERVETLSKKNRALEKEIDKLKQESVNADLDSLLSSAEEVNGTKIIAQSFKDVDANVLRKLSDDIRSKVQDSIVLFGAQTGDKALLLFAGTKKAVEKGLHCGNIIKEAAQLVGGGGGGRPDMAQAGGKNPEKLEEAISKAQSIAKEMIS